MRFTSSIFIATLSLGSLACDADKPAPTPPETAVTMVRIPGGSFMMGALDSDPKARPCERPRHQVTVSEFWLDEHEVTVEAYAAAVAAGAVEPPVNRLHKPWHAEIITWEGEDTQRHPINGVSWRQADAYCRWLGKRLPTEAELEYALRAGQPDALYPWGDAPAPTPGFGNHACSECPPRYAEGHPIEGCDDGFILTAPVKSFEPNAWGLYDISGNVWEWASDWYGERWFRPAPVVDPKGPLGGDRDHKILKGGGHHCVLEELRISERHHKSIDDGAIFSGLRCASDRPSP